MDLLEKKTIKIGGKDYSVVITVRALIGFQKQTGKPVSEMSTFEDITVYFYHTFKAGGNDLTYDEFLDLIDHEPQAITDFTELMTVKEVKKPKVR